MTISEEVLARQAANRLVAAACVSMVPEWSRREGAHEQATTPEDAVAAAAPLVRVCRGRPILTECATWAVLDSYTGVADGALWVKGIERDIDLVRHRGQSAKDESEQLTS